MTPVTNAEACVCPAKKALRWWRTSGKPTLEKRLAPLIAALG